MKSKRGKTGANLEPGAGETGSRGDGQVAAGRQQSAEMPSAKSKTPKAKPTAKNPPAAKKRPTPAAPEKAAPKPTRARRAASSGRPTRARRISGEERRRLVAEAAYLLAERRGFAPGGEAGDWYEAEAEVDARLASLGIAVYD